MMFTRVYNRLSIENFELSKNDFANRQNDSKQNKN